MTEAQHTVWFCLYWREEDFVLLARRALELNTFLALATEHGLGWGEFPATETRDFGVAASTEQLAAFLTALEAVGVRCGTVDCRNDMALALCQRFQVAAECCDSFRLPTARNLS